MRFVNPSTQQGSIFISVLMIVAAFVMYRTDHRQFWLIAILSLIVGLIIGVCFAEVFVRRQVSLAGRVGVDDQSMEGQ